MITRHRLCSHGKRGYFACHRGVTLLLPLILLALPQMVLAADITLAWDSNAESDVAGYKLHYGTGSGKFTHSKDVGNVTQVTLKLPKKKQYIALTAYDIYGNESDFSNRVSWPIQISRPNGSEILHPLDSAWIEWGADSEAVSFTLSYSLNEGKTWSTIRENVTGSSHNWTVPIPANNKRKCMVRVIGYEESGKKFASDNSDGLFAIEVTRLISPSESGEILYSGETYPISWEIYETIDTVAQVELFYTKDGGARWNLIDSIDGSPENYDWVVPTVSSAKIKCKVKVVLRDANGKTVGSDSSSAFFTIQP